MFMKWPACRHDFEKISFSSAISQQRLFKGCDSYNIFLNQRKDFFFFFSKNPAWTSLQTLLTPCLTESVEGAPKCEGQFKPSFKPSKWLRLNGRLDKDWPDDWKYGGRCEETWERETSWWAGETTADGSGPTGLMQVGEEHKNTEQTARHHWLTVLHVKNYES